MGADERGPRTFDQARRTILGVAEGIAQPVLAQLNTGLYVPTRASTCGDGVKALLSAQYVSSTETRGGLCTRLPGQGDVRRHRQGDSLEDVRQGAEKENRQLTFPSFGALDG